jgi:hypothetical protein
VDQSRRYDEIEDRRLMRAARNIQYIEGCIRGTFTPMVEVVGLSVRAPTVDKPDFLVVLRGLDGEGAPVVAFHGADDLIGALGGAGERLRNGTLNWRLDQFGR